MLTLANSDSGSKEINRNVKSQPLDNHKGFQALVHEPDGNLTKTDTAYVDAYLIGKWK